MTRKSSLLLALSILLSPILAIAQTATVNWTDVHQIIDGFGAADAQRGTSLSSSNQAFFFGKGTGQLGLSLLRAGVTDGSDDPGSCLTVSTSCAGVYVSDMNAIIAQGGRVYASPWSPPAAYKTNDSTYCTAGAGDGALATADYASYATWMANFVKSLSAEDGINLYAISVQNEPDQCQGYDSALWTAANIDTFIKTNLGPTFSSDGLTTLIFMPENGSHGDLTGANGGGTCAGDSSCYNYIGGINWHDYDATANSSGTVNTAANPWSSLNKKYWETEVSCGGTSPDTYGPSGCEHGSFTTDMTTDGLMWAGLIDNRIAVQNANAYLYWLLEVPSSYGDSEGLTEVSSEGETGFTAIAKRAYVFGQYAHWIRPGYYRIDATHNPQSGIAVSAYQDLPSKTLVIVATNYNASPVSQTFSVTNAPTLSTMTPYVTSTSLSLAAQSAVTVTSQSFSYSLPAQSVTTFVGTVSSGSSCPSGVPSGVTNCYYASAAGSDSNSGTSESSPFLHAPGMSACSGTCASTHPTGATGIILRGGDTWHFGNSAASPYVGAGNPGWNVTWSGSSGAPIYWGYDPTWYSGGSFTRPALSGDNPTSSVGVSSCTYDESTYTALNYSGQSYNIFDNFEMKGFCWHGNQSTANEDVCCLVHISGAHSNTTPTYDIVQNMWIHGWSHETFSCSLSGGEPTGNCDGAKGIDEGSNSNYGQGDTIANNAFDGSDTDEQSLCAVCFGGYDIHNNIFRYLANAVVTNNTHVAHDNVFDHLHSSGDGISHTNAMKFNAEWAAPNAHYNNVFSNNWLTGSCEVSRWLMPSSTDNDFNSVQYNRGCIENFMDLASTYGTGWTSNIFNETWILPGNAPINANPASTTVAFNNNHGISANATTASGFFAGAGTITYATNTIQTTTASEACYSASSTYPYFPANAGCPTVGSGTNYTSTFCAALLGSSDALLQQAGAACEKDTTLGVSWNATTHILTWPARTPNARPATGNWNAGAYQYLAGAPPSPPTDLTATPF
jgi:glucuronoarabinoxylan endo-1,4-beta-xylanase